MRSLGGWGVWLFGGDIQGNNYRNHFQYQLNKYLHSAIMSQNSWSFFWLALWSEASPVLHWWIVWLAEVSTSWKRGHWSVLSSVLHFHPDRNTKNILNLHVAFGCSCPVIFQFFFNCGKNPRHWVYNHNHFPCVIQYWTCSDSVATIAYTLHLIILKLQIH